MTEERIREMLRELGDEPVPADSLLRVRTGVAQRIRARRTRGRWGALLLAPAALAIVLLIPFTPAPRDTKLTPPKLLETAGTALAPQVEVNTAPVTPLTRHRIRHTTHRPEPAHSPSSGFLIRIETPDPEVVILLIGD